MTQRRPDQNDRLMFITTNTHNRMPIFKNPAFAKEAIDQLYRVQALYPFFLFGFVIMPDHCHYLLNVPSPGSISKIMNVYKSGLSFQLGIGKTWQPRYHSMFPNDAWRTLEYIYMNPVRKKLCDHPAGYQWSSASGKWDVTTLGADTLV